MRSSGLITFALGFIPVYCNLSEVASGTRRAGEGRPGGTQGCEGRKRGKGMGETERCGERWAEGEREKGRREEREKKGRERRKRREEMEKREDGIGGEGRGGGEGDREGPGDAESQSGESRTDYPIITSQPLKALQVWGCPEAEASALGAHSASTSLSLAPQQGKTQA